MKERSYRAAGGVLFDDAGRVLVIERRIPRGEDCRHEVRLPKGHVEEGETDVEAALREVCEETGYCGIEIVADLGEAVSEFVWDDTRVRRNEHYYLMHVVNPVPVAPQFDSPSSEEARYVTRWIATPTDAEAELTYDTERDFMARARSALRKSREV
jgi:8-oxo-dGTP pyrophosphatase MutT (NUDIX family)